MEYSNDLLKKIETMGADMMTPLEISVLLDIEEDEFQDDIKTHGSAARSAYLRGYIRTVHEIKKNIRDLCDTGSPSAVEQSVGFIKEIEQQII